MLQTITLLDALEELKVDAAMGGARRDEEKARAKERFFSHRDEFGQWDPKNQRPELWNLFNGKKHIGEHFRVFPISNWTEMDVWQYILQENIEIPSIYFTHERECFIRDGVIYAHTNVIPLKPTEKVKKMQVHFRTIGDISCTGAVPSKATTLEEIVEEAPKWDIGFIVGVPAWIQLCMEKIIERYQVKSIHEFGFRLPHSHHAI